MDETLLSLDRVSRRFGGIHAVRDVTATIACGELVGLIGPNGAGKTTLLDLISGVLRPTSGAIAFAGRPTAACPPTASRSWALAAPSRSCGRSRA